VQHHKIPPFASQNANRLNLLRHSGPRIVLRYRCFLLPGTSAAQNGQVIHKCPKCGGLLFEDAGSCSFCDSPLSATPEQEEFATVPSTDVEPDWRREVARRMEIYRARRRRVLSDDSQSPLPFHDDSIGDTEETVEREEAHFRPARKLSPPRPP